MNIDTIVFDMDGVIVDTEQAWRDVRRVFAAAHGGHWDEEVDAPKVMGASSMQWAAAMRDNNGVDLPVEDIYRGIVDGVRAECERDLKVMKGAPEAIAALARVYRLGVASSSPLELIEDLLEITGLRAHFLQVISSDEVGVGKPQPDVYLEACRRLGSEPARAAAVEDSTNGLRAAHAAGMAVIAIPHPAFPASGEAVALADVVLDSMEGLTQTAILHASRR